LGFVIVPKGKYDAANHIKALYSTTPAKIRKTSQANVVNLIAGDVSISAH